MGAGGAGWGRDTSIPNMRKEKWPSSQHHDLLISSKHAKQASTTRRHDHERWKQQNEQTRPGGSTPTPTPTPTPQTHRHTGRGTPPRHTTHNARHTTHNTRSPIRVRAALRSLRLHRRRPAVLACARGPRARVGVGVRRGRCGGRHRRGRRCSDGRSRRHVCECDAMRYEVVREFFLRWGSCR